MIGFTISTLAYRYRILRVPGGFFFERMNKEMNLTSEQRDQIHAIFSDTHHQADDIRREAWEKRKALFDQSWTKIRAVLTPEQQKIFDRDFTPPWHHGWWPHHEGDRFDEPHAPVTQN